MHTTKRPNKAATWMLGLTGLAVVTVTAGAIGMDAVTSEAQAGCPRYITHWGRMSGSPHRARRAAFAGMRWKIRNRLGDTVQVIRGVRIEQCKRRYRYSWQCQTSAVINTCF